MSAAEDVELVHRVYDTINRGDLGALHDLFAPDMVRHDLANLLGESGSSEDVSDFLTQLREALPDLHMEVEDAFATEDGRAAARATLSGTHKGEFLGAAPTGKKVSFAAITLYEIKDGRIAVAWSLVDWAGALRQMQKAG
jgi:steroid delta-isomerase-like uncharacterized protein